MWELLAIIIVYWIQKFKLNVKIVKKILSESRILRIIKYNMLLKKLNTQRMDKKKTQISSKILFHTKTAKTVQKILKFWIYYCVCFLASKIP